MDQPTLKVLPVPIVQGSARQRSQTTIPAVVRDAIGLEHLISRMQQVTESVPLPDPEDDFELDEAEAAEYAELAAKVRAERPSVGVTRNDE